jgi:hypothetical protein
MTTTRDLTLGLRLNINRADSTKLAGVLAQKLDASGRITR